MDSEKRLFIDAILDLSVPEEALAAKGDDIATAGQTSPTTSHRGKNRGIRRELNQRSKARHYFMAKHIPNSRYFLRHIWSDAAQEFIQENRVIEWNMYPWKGKCKKAANHRVRQSADIATRKGGYKNCSPFFAADISRD